MGETRGRDAGRRLRWVSLVLWPFLLVCRVCRTRLDPFHVGRALLAARIHRRRTRRNARNPRLVALALGDSLIERSTVVTWACEPEARRRVSSIRFGAERDRAHVTMTASEHHRVKLRSLKANSNRRGFRTFLPRVASVS